MAVARGSLALVWLIGCAEPGNAVAPVPSTLFITDYRGNSIVRYDGISGALIDVFAQGPAKRVDRPASVQLGPDAQLYSAGFGRGDIVRYDLETGAMMDVFFYDTNLLEKPVELMFWRDEVLVLGNDTKNVVAIDANGLPTRTFGYPTMRGAQDFAIGPDGALYVATESHPQLDAAVQAWDPTTGEHTRAFASIAEVAFASGLAFRDDMLYVCDFQRNQVSRFDPITGAMLDVVVPPGVVTQPMRI